MASLASAACCLALFQCTFSDFDIVMVLYLYVIYAGKCMVLHYSIFYIGLVL